MAAGARAFSGQEEGVLRGEGGVREKQTPTESADSASFEELALRGIYIRAESCQPPLDDGVDETSRLNNEVSMGSIVKGAGESLVRSNLRMVACE